MSRWSPQRDARLTVLWAERLSAEKIALKLGEGLTRNAIIGRAHRLHLPPHGPIPRTSQRHRRKQKPRPFKPIPPEEDRKARKAYMREHTKQQPVAPKPSKPPTSAPLSKKLTITELVDLSCRWPGDDEPLTTFCGQDRLPGLSYCVHHALIAYPNFTMQQAEELLRREAV